MAWVRLGVALGLLGCAAPEAAEGDLTSREGAVSSAPLILFQWEPESSVAGRLRGVGPEGVVYAGLLRLSDRSRRAEAIPERGAVEPGTEVGAQVFNPFPEAWPKRSRAASERVRTVLADERGRSLECRFQVPSPDEGIRPPLLGTCRSEDGRTYRARVE